MAGHFSMLTDGFILGLLYPVFVSFR